MSQRNRDDVTIEQAMGSKLLYDMYNRHILIVAKFQSVTFPVRLI